MSNFIFQPNSARGFTAAPKPATPAAGPATPAAPTHDAIARRAYEIYIKKGRQQGQCKQNWRQAEQDLQHEGKTTCAGPQCGRAEAPAARAGSQPAGKAVAGALPPIVGGGDSTRGGTTRVRTGGGSAQA
jgi:hypothetical protein